MNSNPSLQSPNYTPLRPIAYAPYPGAPIPRKPSVSFNSQIFQHTLRHRLVNRRAFELFLEILSIGAFVGEIFELIDELIGVTGIEQDAVFDVLRIVFNRNDMTL